MRREKHSHKVRMERLEADLEVEDHLQDDVRLNQPLIQGGGAPPSSCAHFSSSASLTLD